MGLYIHNLIRRYDVLLTHKGNFTNLQPCAGKLADVPPRICLLSFL